MQEVTFTMEVITPLFLTGADQNIAELRPQGSSANNFHIT